MSVLPILPVKTILLGVVLPNIISGEEIWRKIKFENQNVTDDATELYQLTRSKQDVEIGRKIQEENVDWLNKWAEGSFDWGVHAYTLKGFLKGKNGVVSICWPTDTVEKVLLVRTIDGGTPDERRKSITIPWSKQNYVVLQSESEAFGSLDKRPMSFYMVRAWKKSKEQTPREGAERGI